MDLHKEKLHNCNSAKQSLENKQLNPQYLNLESNNGFSLTNNVSQNTKNYFKIRKFLKYDKIASEILKEQCKVNLKEVVPNSPITDTSITESEKVKKMIILSKIIRRYKRKLKVYKSNLKSKMQKLFRKKLKIINTSGIKYNSGLTLENLIKAMKRLNNNKFIEFSNERILINELGDLISSKKLSPDSIKFKKICSQIRLFLKPDKILQDSPTPLVYLNLKKKVYISQLECLRIQKLNIEISDLEIIFGVNIAKVPEKKNNVISFKDKLQSSFDDLDLFMMRENTDDLLSANNLNVNFI